MSNVQRVIKYLAIAFAIFLVLNIVSSIILGINIINNLFDDKEIVGEKLEELTITANPSILNIETASVNVILKEGNVFKVETNNNKITALETANKLVIKEKSYNWFGKTNTGDLIVYIPSTLFFEDVTIESGAGKVSIKSLVTNKLDLDLGAGKVDIDGLIVERQTEINGGAGEIVIRNSKLNNLDLDQGVGKVSITSELIGINEINAGVGEVEVCLLGLKEQYRISADKGIGSIKIDGTNIKNSTYYGGGNNIIDIDGGVGNINLYFKNKD